ncbi:MAG: acetyl/propionyl/methylcrotonyl-CoA carboxylase subunit alpha [Gammaproteobacteria bacterium]|nr:acetyl/propionyl/methylcrotonyl-CoA carboxylase subunit alpha [Gammaproteobacteria bacterium]MBQ0839927.1 acetyl/propionyl/methylcrotonyl-CoA carboxylase subunit alpha [Gammaproteobacteria bacterium]
MFDKILIANRGEIACRVIRTARKLGIRTVAVYSDADANALHVSMADEAVHIGGSPSKESYLLADRVLDAAKLTGAQAVHPGYGFLSENAAFSEACKSNDIVFIGPPVGAIESMGSKSAAKQIMEKAGVPLVPGYHGDDQSPAILKQHADAMGYPVLLKATAGGGGKGMREVWKSEDFDEALEAAKRESLSSFGDDRMLVEKYLTQPRHVEIQVFCDQAGNGVYLFERDCSVQRRHQKVIEEAPAPGMNPMVRAAMGDAALLAAKAINYEGAGTVEFLLDKDDTFFFMEMNTRLQVEHPVTEMITGQDLVEWQLRVAAGQDLPLTQEQLQINGHSFEARIYAEDPDNDFLPVTGTLSYLQPPEESPHVRVDTGVLQGDEVSVFYDPMIAKLIVWDENRDRALSRLAEALSQYRISGMTTNVEFLYNLATAEPFRKADLDTGFIEKHRELIFHKKAEEVERYVPLATLYLILKRNQDAAALASQSADPHSPWHATNGWRSGSANVHDYPLLINGEEVTVLAEQIDASRFSLTTRGSASEVSIQLSGSLNGSGLHADIDGHRVHASVVAHDGIYSLFTQDAAVQFSVIEPDCGDLDDEAAAGFTAPMTGTIVALPVEAGTPVKKDQAIVIMEAMKMEHTIRAPADGTVVEFYCQPGDLVDGGAELVNFEAAKSESKADSE